MFGFVKNMVNGMDISLIGIKVGVIIYSDWIYFEFYLNVYSDKILFE